MNAVKEFGLRLVSLGIHVINPYLHLPHKLRYMESLFGKKDLKKKKYVQLPHKVRSKIYYLIGDEIKEIVGDIREPDHMTKQIQTLAITSNF